MTTSTKPVILLLIDTLTTGGAEKSLLEIAIRLEQFTPVICTVFSKNADLKADVHRSGLKLIELNVTGTLWWWEGRAKLAKVIQDLQPALIHATLFRAEIVARITRGTGIPLLGSFVNDSYGIERYRGVTLWMGFKLRVVQWIDRISAKRVSHFMAITRSIVSTNATALGIPTKKITVIYRGRDLEKMHVSNESQVHEVRQKYNGPLFLTVARLLKRKGYTESIKAFSKVLRDFPEAKYLIAGEGHDRKEFETLICSLGLQNKVILLGTRSDVPVLLKASDYFIFPSHYEGQGGAMVEAMLFAKPIIATDIPVISEQVTHNVSARLFELRNSNSLYTEMIWMLRHREAAQKLGMRAREYAMEAFNIASIARQHEHLYLKLIQQKKKAVRN